MTGYQDYREFLAAIIGKMKTARREQKLTQKTLAGIVGITHDYYSKIERGHNVPKLDLFLKICRVLNIGVMIIDSDMEPVNIKMPAFYIGLPNAIHPEIQCMELQIPKSLKEHCGEVCLHIKISD